MKDVSLKSSVRTLPSCLVILVFVLCVFFVIVGFSFLFAMDANSGSSGGVLCVVPSKNRKHSEPAKWKKNKAKSSRQSGQEYQDYKGRRVERKQFSLVAKCCSKLCSENVPGSIQENLFDQFWGSGSKHVQDTYLSSLVDPVPIRKQVVNPRIPRSTLWGHSVSMGERSFDVCQDFVLKLFQIGRKRLRNVKAKKIAGISFDDRRGKHDNRPHKHCPEVWDMIKTHLISIPHKTSHYARHKTNLFYFDNPELNTKKIFFKFKDFYKKKTGNTLKLAYDTYRRFFKESCNFAFRQPKTDVCDFCTKAEMKLKKDGNDPIKLDLTLHRRRVARHLSLKRGFIEDAKTGDTCLVLEFDYGQNFPIPKLNVTQQFYKRLLWMYMFNVHVHNDDRSFMYSFMEGYSKKGANSVASFLCDVLNKLMPQYPNLTEVVFLSDACGGQNKNKVMVQFGCWVAKAFNVNVVQLFPVRGHSFCICDRNFGLVRSRIKYREKIYTAKPYLSAMVQARNNPRPFDVLMDHTIINDWEAALAPLFEKNPKSLTKGNSFKIQQYKMLRYSPTGLRCYTTYCSDVYMTFKYWKRTCEQNLSVNLLLCPVKRAPINTKKIKDVKDLFGYLSEEGRKWIGTLFQETQRASPLAQGGEESDNYSEDSLDEEC